LINILCNGPTFYIILENVLKPINIFLTYADGTNLLVSKHTDVQLCDEYEAIQLWALRNKMIINASKNKEIVVRRPNPRKCRVASIQAIEKIRETKLLMFVIFSDSFLFDSLVNYILKICSRRRSYLMHKLRNQGLTTNQLNMVFYIFCMVCVPGLVFFLLNSLDLLMHSVTNVQVQTL